jgi:hypothetical protein
MYVMVADLDGITTALYQCKYYLCAKLPETVSEALTAFTSLGDATKMQKHSYLLSHHQGSQVK